MRVIQSRLQLPLISFVHLFFKIKEIKPSTVGLGATGNYLCQIQILKLNVWTAVCEFQHHFSLESGSGKKYNFQSFHFDTFFFF